MNNPGEIARRIARAITPEKLSKAVSNQIKAIAMKDLNPVKAETLKPLFDTEVDLSIGSGRTVFPELVNLAIAEDVANELGHGDLANQYAASTAEFISKYIKDWKIVTECLSGRGLMYHVDENMCEAMLYTRPTVPVSMLKLPFDLICIEIPSHNVLVMLRKTTGKVIDQECEDRTLNIDALEIGMMPLEIIEGDMSCILHETSTMLPLDDHHMSICIPGEEKTIEAYFARLFDIMRANNTEEYVIQRNVLMGAGFEKRWKLDDVVDMNARLLEAVNIAINSMLYISTPSPDVVENTVKYTQVKLVPGQKKRGKPRMKKIEKTSEAPIFIIGNESFAIPKPDVHQTSEQSGGKWKVRVLMPGSYQMRRYGSMELGDERPLRNVWVKWHWKGPEDAPIGRRPRVFTF